MTTVPHDLVRRVNDQRDDQDRKSPQDLRIAARSGKLMPRAARPPAWIASAAGLQSIFPGLRLNAAPRGRSKRRP